MEHVWGKIAEYMPRYIIISTTKGAAFHNTRVLDKSFASLEAAQSYLIKQLKNRFFSQLYTILRCNPNCIVGISMNTCRFLKAMFKSLSIEEEKQLWSKTQERNNIQLVDNDYQKYINFVLYSKKFKNLDEREQEFKDLIDSYIDFYYNESEELINTMNSILWDYTYSELIIHQIPPLSEN